MVFQDVSLMERTKALAVKAAKTLSQIEIAEGANVSPAWLSRFINGEIKEPSVNAVERLYKYLTGQGS